MLLLIFAATAAVFILNSQGLTSVRIKSYAKRIVSKIMLPPLINEKQGLGSVIGVKSDYNWMKIYETENNKRFINYAEGFYFDVPKDFEFSYDRPYVTAYSEGGRIVATREWVFEKSADEYIEHYLNRFIINPTFQEKNNVAVVENTDNGSLHTITAVINELEESYYDKYTYAFIETKTPNFYRIMFKYSSKDTEFEKKIQRILKSFKAFSPGKSPEFNTDFKPLLPDGWNNETKALYNRISTANQIYWGVFAKDIYGEIGRASCRERV